jgi:FixJ family two-component response regulator
VVDDEEPVRRGLERLLRLFGFEVTCFESGAEFLASLSDRLPDCVILDLHMPKLDGFAVLERMAGSGVRVPVIVMTGRDTPETLERARSHDVSGYLRKPIDGTVLQEAISASQKNP